MLSAYTIVFAAALVPAGAGPTGPVASGPSSSGWASSPRRPPSGVSPTPACSSPPASPGQRRGPHAAHLARPAPPRLRARTQGCGHRPVVGRRWRGGRRPPIGGLLVQVSWRWVFLVNLPFAPSLSSSASAAEGGRRIPPPTRRTWSGPDCCRSRGQPGGRHREGFRLGRVARHPDRLCCGHRLDGGWCCARGTHPTRSSSRP